MAKKKTIEKDIEEYLGKRAKEEDAIYFKFVSPGNSGVPDRILIVKGYTIFIELKAPGETTRDLQTETIKKMRRRGATVFVFDNKEQIDELFFNIKHNKPINDNTKKGASV